MLFFYMVVLFLIFLIQFSVSCAALAINEDDEKKIVMTSWKTAYGVSNTSSVILQAEQTFGCCGLTADDMMDVTCEKVTACTVQNATAHTWSCPPCMDKIQDKVDSGFNGAGVVGLIFSFTELIGGIVACRYRNQFANAQAPSTPFGSS